MRNLIFVLTQWLIAFFLAIFIALWEISIPTPKELFNSLNKLIIIHPLPVPMSNIVFSEYFSLWFSKNQETNSSVSGLGINTNSFKINFFW